MHAPAIRLIISCSAVVKKRSFDMFISCKAVILHNITQNDGEYNVSNGILFNSKEKITPTITMTNIPT